MSFIVAYVTVLLVFGAFDAVWISQVALPLYRDMLGEGLLQSIRIWPAIVFYFAFPVGIVVFAVRPALRDGRVGTAIGLGALYGALCYGTYDLTNYATLDVWRLDVTVVDIVYGAGVSAICAAAAFFVARKVG